MADLKGRITALELRRRQEQSAHRLGMSKANLDPAQAAEAYEQIMNPHWVPTAEEVQRSNQWSLLTAIEASTLYSEYIRDPAFDVNRAVAETVQGREQADLRAPIEGKS